MIPPGKLAGVAVVLLASLTSLAGTACRSDVVLANRGTDDGGADAGNDGGVASDGGVDAGMPACGDPCDASQCGPAPALERRCLDGVTTSASSGRCMRDRDLTCAWEIIRCPEARTCTDAECGPAPGAPAYMCPDGSLGGNTGLCLRSADGNCGWSFRDCPAEACATEACGPASTVPIEPCADGVNSSGPTGRCLRGADGACAWETAACPYHESFCAE